MTFYQRIQKKYYSGKKKRHTVEPQITINTKGKILMVSKSYPGRVHDYKIFKQEKTALPLPRDVLIENIPEYVLSLNMS